MFNDNERFNVAECADKSRQDILPNISVAALHFVENLPKYQPGAGVKYTCINSTNRIQFVTMETKAVALSVLALFTYKIINRSSNSAGKH